MLIKRRHDLSLTDICKCLLPIRGWSENQDRCLSAYSIQNINGCELVSEVADHHIVMSQHCTHID